MECILSNSNIWISTIWAHGANKYWANYHEESQMNSYSSDKPGEYSKWIVTHAI